MISMPEDLPDDPVLLKQLLAQLLIERTADKGHIVDLKEQIKLLRDRLFGRKSEQTVEPNTPQLALFNEPESEPMLPVGDAEEEVVAPVKRRGNAVAASMSSAKKPVSSWISCRCRSV
ncbi:transposase IS66 [Pseudomonas syringae pv. actinidiae ICMP 18801]|nr:transposase IS66 [Pseudomonas syringae pv. actinidiae ICMP 18801]